MSVVATPTPPAVSATAPSSTSDALSAGAIVGIVAGSVIVLVLLGALVFYLLRRRGRHEFSRVANPFSTSAAGPDLPGINSKHFSHSSQRPFASEPLISPISWPPIPPTSRVLPFDSAPRTDSITPIKEGSFSLDEVIAARKSEQTPPPSPRSQQQFFVHRMLQSRARASEGTSPGHQPSLDLSPSPTLDASAIYADVERLVADAERTALRDAESAQREEEGMLSEEEETESVYSQPSMPIDHFSLLSNPHSRQDSTASVHRRKSSRRQPPPRTAELTPVAEVPDVLRASRPASVAANLSLDAPMSVSRPMPVVDPPGTLPLLTSADFGKESAASGSLSTAGWGSGSSGRASRYPSLAPSSTGLSSQSPPRSEGGADWRHPPPGLSGLTEGPLRNPHPPAPDRRAHLRAGTTGSMAEVERRTVVQGGIARIDVAL